MRVVVPLVLAKGYERGGYGRKEDQAGVLNLADRVGHRAEKREGQLMNDRGNEGQLDQNWQVRLEDLIVVNYCCEGHHHREHNGGIDDPVHSGLNVLGGFRAYDGFGGEGKGGSGSVGAVVCTRLRVFYC